MDQPQLEQLINSVQNLPYHQFIGLKIVDWGPGFCETQISLTANTANPVGVLHGGIHYTVCDVTAYIAASTMVPNDRLAVTSDLNVSILSAVTKGTLVIKAQVIKMGKRICFVESKVWDEENNLVAVARATKSLIRVGV